MEIILLCIGICTLYSILLYRILKKKLKSDFEEKKILKSLKEEVNSLIIEINETSDRNINLLENRLERLSSALKEADRTLLVMKRETEKNERSAEVYTHLSRKAPSVMPASPAYVVTESHTTEAVSVPVSTAVAVAERPEEPEFSENSEPLFEPGMNKQEKVLFLYKQGISPGVIAAKSGATIGEVELIISLNRGAQ